MFKKYERYRNVLVVGPHRSGTTFLTHAIAHDLSRTAVDEYQFRHNRMDLLDNILTTETGLVIQAPQALPWLPILMQPQDIAVYIVRDHTEIAESYRRSRTPKRRPIPPAPFTPAQAFRMWCKIFLQCPGSDMVEYNELYEHPLFVPKKDRARWHYKQVDNSGKRHERKRY